MVEIIDITSSILSKNVTHFDKSIHTKPIQLPIEQAKIGILNFKAITAKQTNSEIDFLFMIDRSGSMSDLCSDKRTKMQHIIHTLKNMILFFRENPTVKINVTVITFDTKIHEIISRKKISEENINEIIYKIEKISSRGSTNIELALEKAINKINELKQLYPDNSIHHIFMTDGEATEGSGDIAFLKRLIHPNVHNSFIGFGIDHDSVLLNEISSVGKSAYYFIDKLESAGLVYGEILHGIIYNLLKETEIIVENGLIYDFKTNTWVNTLKIGDIASEADKTYNIISSNPEVCKVTIKAIMDDLIIYFPSTQDLEENTLDFTCHLYRLRTLQLLYEVNEFCKRKREIENKDNSTQFIRIHTTNDEEILKEQMILKNKLGEFIVEMKNYMTDHDLQNDKILKNLCDDIYICYRTLGTKYGNMFCTARQTSQGTQRQYTVSNTVEVTEEFCENRVFQRRARNISPLPRQINNTNILSLDDFQEYYNDSILQHEVSHFDDTPYLTPQATQVMRSVSAGIDEEY